MMYGDQHPAFHLLKAIALFGLFIAGMFATALAAYHVSQDPPTDPDGIQALSWMFNGLSVALLAVFVWSVVELSAAIWSINAVRSGADRLWLFVVGRFQRGDPGT